MSSNMAPDIKVYRRSELQAVDDGCLHRYNEIWRNGIDDTSDIASIGIGFHAIKHRYVLRLVENQTPADHDEAMAAFEEGVAAVKTPSRLIPNLRGVWDYHAESFQLPVDRFVAAEERQRSNTGITWAPDLVLAHPETNELEIKDDKSGWAPPLTEDELRLLFQARVYSFYGMLRWPGFSSYRFTINAIRYGKSTSVVFTQQELDNVDRELQAHIATIHQAEADGLWPAVAGPACRFCELKCPLLDTPAVMPKRFLEAQQAQQVAAWVIAADQMIKTAKKALKGYCAAHGPLNIGGVEWNNRAVLSRTYPINKVIEVLTERGAMGAFDASEADGLTVSHSALAKVFKRFPTLEDDFKVFAKEKTSYRFTAQKPKSADGDGDGDDE